MLRFSIFVITCSVFLGCAVGPNYESPTSKLPKNFRLAKDEIFKSKDLNLVWWKSFHDQTLENLIVKAVKSNRSVQQALTRVNQSRAIAREQLAELLPGLQIGGSYDRRKISGVQFGGRSLDYRLYRTGIDATWELDLFGGLRRGLEAANADYAYRVADLDQSIQVLISDLAIAYFQLRAAQKQLKIAERNLEIQGESLKIVEAKFQAGRVSELDFSTSQTQYAQTQARLGPLKSLVQISIHRISVLCGKNPDRFRRQLLKYQELPEYRGPISIGQIEEIIARRPDVRMAERNLAKYTAQIGIQVAELFPKINLSGSIGYENTQLGGLIDADRRVWGMGPQISWTPLDLGRIRSRIKAADAQAKEALAKYQETILLALEDVANSFSSYNSEKERAEYLQMAMLAAERSYQLAEASYQVGKLDRLVVIDAQKQMLATQNDFALNQQNYAISIVDIYKALGSGWQAWDLIKQ